jgi:hypothetical protein
MADPAGSMLRMTLTNSNEGGVLNLAQFGIECASTFTLGADVAAAGMIAYVVKARGAFLASGTLITRVQWREHGTGGFIDVPFPDALYNDMVDVDSDLVHMHDYADTVLGASGGLAPVGTSVCVTEYSAGFGRRSRGRHFLPFVNKAKVDGNGLFAAEDIALVEAAYNSYILNLDDDPVHPSLLPVILSATLTTQTVITHVKAQPVLSNLRSRRR